MIHGCLIVDDSPAFVTSARELLESQGVSVAACASSTAEALAAAERSKPEFVLVDVELGGEDGLDLARSLLALDPTIRIVLMSAYDCDDCADLAAECGAAGFISKTALSAQAIRDVLAR